MTKSSNKTEISLCFNHQTKQAQKYISLSKYDFRHQIFKMKMSFPISTTTSKFITYMRAIVKMVTSSYLEFVMIPLLIHSWSSVMTKLFHY